MSWVGLPSVPIPKTINFSSCLLAASYYCTCAHQSVCMQHPPYGISGFGIISKMATHLWAEASEFYFSQAGASFFLLVIIVKFLSWNILLPLVCYQRGDCIGIPQMKVKCLLSWSSFLWNTFLMFPALPAFSSASHSWEVIIQK